MLVRLRRMLAQTTRAALALEVSAQSPHLRVVAKMPRHLYTPDKKLLDLPPPLRYA
jgi:hypothetical protein